MLLWHVCHQEQVVCIKSISDATKGKGKGKEKGKEKRKGIRGRGNKRKGK
jgi:hypothetical protein